MDQVEDCALRHETVSGLHDVYSSWKYPAHPACDVTTPTGSSDSQADTRPVRCRRPRWYLGVSKNGTLRTFAERKLLRNRVMFTQRWLHRPGTQDNGAPPAGLVPGVPHSDSGGAEGRSAQRRRGDRKPVCSGLLRQCRRRGSRTYRQADRLTDKQH